MSIKYEDRTVIYEEKEYKALEILKKLDLNATTYYNQRKKGKSAQEAFLYCWNIKQKQNIKQVAEKNQIHPDTIYRGIRNNMTLDEIIEDQKEKKEQQLQTLEYLRKIGLPLEYNSLTDFCTQEQLNIVKVYKRIQKGMNLYDAVEGSLNISCKSNSNICYGVQLKSLAKRYSLDSNQLNMRLRKGYSYEETIEREVFARTFSAFQNDFRRFVYLWNVYQNEFLKGISIQDKVTDNELESFVVCYNRMQHIKRDLVYYAFLESVNIPVYKLLSLDERVRDVLLTDPNVSFTLNELYYILDFENGLMHEFTYMEPQQMWVFNGNREVLKKLKKPSN